MSKRVLPPAASCIATLFSGSLWLLLLWEAGSSHPSLSRALPLAMSQQVQQRARTTAKTSAHRSLQTHREFPETNGVLDLWRDQARSSNKEIQASFAGPASTPAFTWINTGPVNPIGRLAGLSGKLQAFAWEPSHPKVMYAGGGVGSGNERPLNQSGIFKSVDGGRTWAQMSKGLTDTTVNVLWIDPSNPGALLAGTEYGGLFRTTNGGQAWMQVSPNAPISAIVAVPGGILAGTGEGFEFSNDEGATWNILQKTSSPVRCMAVNGSNIIAGLEHGAVLWRGSADRNWRTVVAPNPQFTVWDIAIDPVDPNVAYYVRGYTGPPDNVVLRTKDRGVSWQSINAPPSTSDGYSQALAVRSSDRAVLVAGQEMFYQSLDFGATWTKLFAPWDSRRIFLLPNSTSLVMGSDQGLHWTDDMGKTWRHISKSISSNILYGVAVSGDTILTSSQDFGPFLSSDRGKTWSAPLGPLGEGGGVAINPGDPHYCYAFTITGFAYSHDSCVSFQYVNGPTWQNYVAAANQNLIAVDLNNPSTIYVGAYDGVWSSTDWGVTLKRLSWPMQQVSNVALDPQDPLAIYVCASSGFYQSLTGGATWTLMPLPKSSSPYVAAVSPMDSNIILVALTNGAGRPQGGVLRSADRGLTFDFVNHGLSTVNFNLGVDQQSLAFNPAPPKGTIPVVALATTGGIYASADLGSTWQDIRFNAVPHVFSFVHWDQGYLWATTFGEGVLRSDRPLTDSMLKSTPAVIGVPVSFFNTIGARLGRDRSRSR